MKVLKLLGFLGLGIYSVYGLARPALFSFLDGANLLFHEAGHVFFSPLGEYFHFWGGTLTQLGIPLGIGAGFLFKRQPASAAVMLWWGSQNLISISAYIKDARTQALDLVGGEIHDWNYLLSAHGMLERDQMLGAAVFFLGAAGMLSAAALGFRAVCSEKRG